MASGFSRDHMKIDGPSKHEVLNQNPCTNSSQPLRRRGRWGKLQIESNEEIFRKIGCFKSEQFLPIMPRGSSIVVKRMGQSHILRAMVLVYPTSVKLPFGHDGAACKRAGWRRIFVVNAVAPGPIRSGFSTDSWANKDWTTKRKQQVQYGSGRIGEPENWLDAIRVHDERLTLHVS